VNNHTIFFLSAEVSPLERQLYSVSIDGTAKARITTEDGWFSASFDPWTEYYILTSAGPQIPTQHIRSSLDPALSIVLEDNKELRDNLAQYELPQKKFITVPLHDGEKMNAYLLFPPDFDETSKYPVLVNVYGGPGSQTVTKMYELGFHAYVASQLGYIVASVDGRGTGARGNHWQKQTYLNLGVLEVQDQITAAKYLQTLEYVDGNHIGIWGWSYGGFMTSSIMSTIDTPFKFGMCVAPVTDWRFYDTVYTERYMRTPQENPNGYNITSVLNHAANMKDNTFLLAHGSGDDNVHFLNSAELMKILVNKDIQFEFMMYPNRDHSISAGARPHLYHFLANYLELHSN
jgi:dipeptidyl-peptidase-4